MSTRVLPQRRSVGRLPWSALLALGTAVFITSLTETLPAGVLPGMADGLSVTPSAAGQSVTVYALGTVLTALPLARVTAGWRRRRVLLTTMVGFALANTVTALTPDYTLALVSRAAAGVAAGLAWALLAGYARRLAPPGQEGRAIAVAMTGIPLALSLGVPAGTLLGDVLGWRAAFLAVSALTLIVIGWIRLSVADFAGQVRSHDAGDEPGRVRDALRVAGVPTVLWVTGVVVLGHTVAYAYVSAVLAAVGLGYSTGSVLLVFGVCCLVSIAITARRVDVGLRALTVLAAVLVVIGLGGLAGLELVPAGVGRLAVAHGAAALWGLGWGGMPTVLQTAVGAAGARGGHLGADTAQAALVTVWNAAMAAGGLVGGVLVAGLTSSAVPAVGAGLVVVGLIVIRAGRADAFGSRSSGDPAG